MRDLLADLALWRAEVLARRAERLIAETPARHPLRARAGRLLVRSERWHDLAAWLDGIGAWPGWRA